MRKLLTLTMASLLTLTIGCTNSGERNNSTPTVVTATYALEFIAQQVVGEHAEVSSLAVPGAEPHDLALQPSQVASIASATVVFYATGLQPEVDKVIANQKPAFAVDATGLTGSKAASLGEQRDPHFWLDPTLMAKATDGFATQMSKADPDHADSYAANAAALEQRLKGLDSEFKKGLATCELRDVVVSHDAFSYLGARYGLEFHSIAGLSPDAEPSPRHLQELIDLIETSGIDTVFYEPIAGNAQATTLAKETGTKLSVLDPIEAIQSGAKKDYFDLMHSNLQALRKANRCQ
ncbi:MAG TPA: metal ABC transporter substrate-binding protein [Marmoricola sp.]|nr:metal ABC transporter substrate-binding protein [Marmoricola sp.]HMY08585.1 metal ABC transporter substrate-binding protein [Marmoricola sp.]HRV70348.1 metal ABC transporter substrate-binding protein [Marmoricola sp.]